MKTNDLLKILNEFSRLRLLLNMSLAEVLNVAKDENIDIYHELTYALSELNDKLNNKGE